MNENNRTETNILNHSNNTLGNCYQTAQFQHMWKFVHMHFSVLLMVHSMSQMFTIDIFINER